MSGDLHFPVTRSFASNMNGGFCKVIPIEETGKYIYESVMNDNNVEYFQMLFRIPV